jgi:hypothetical protein
MAVPIGYRDINQQPIPDSLRGRMVNSPEGRQLTVDGSFLFAVVDEDPATSTDIPGNGRPVIYDRAGTLELWGFTRGTGWQQL